MGCRDCVVLYGDADLSMDNVVACLIDGLGCVLSNYLCWW